MICLSFCGLGERGDSSVRFGLGCLLERRLGILIGRPLDQDLYDMDCCEVFGLEMWIQHFFGVG